MQPLEIALLAVSLLMTLFALGAATVGVWVLIRTARVPGLEVEVSKLADLVQTFRSRDARRAPARTKERATDTVAQDADGGVVDMEARKAQVASEFARSGHGRQ